MFRRDQRGSGRNGCRSCRKQTRETGAGDSVVFDVEAADALSAPRLVLDAAETQSAVEPIEGLIGDFQGWSGGEPPGDFDQINTYVTAALPTGIFSEDDARRWLDEWGQAEGDFR